jgi:hypothetical protein
LRGGARLWMKILDTGGLPSTTRAASASHFRQNATSEADAPRPKHERGQDGRDSLFRRFGVSVFARRDREDQIPVKEGRVGEVATELDPRSGS